MITEKKYLGAVASLGCMVCGGPAEIHHIRQFAGMSQRASNWLVVPLCPGHHRTGRNSIHNNTMNEGAYLAKTIEAVVNLLARRK